MIHISEERFTLIKLGIKTCEGRLFKGDFSLMKKDDIITFINNDFFQRRIDVKITSVKRYNSFESYLYSEKLERCLPGIDNIDDGYDIYSIYISIDMYILYIYH
jgi:ASC-1-like (ASCH) protein